MDTTSGFNSPTDSAGRVVFTQAPSLIAADLKYQLYADSNQTLDTTVNTPAGPSTTSQPLNWKNTLGIGLGVECTLIQLVPIRIGYSLSQSATPESTANPFTPPPGAIHGAHFGVGLRLIPALDIDAAVCTPTPPKPSLPVLPTRTSSPAITDDDVLFCAFGNFPHVAPRPPARRDWPATPRAPRSVVRWSANGDGPAEIRGARRLAQDS
jgi:hypothetical protein